MDECLSVKFTHSLNKTLCCGHIPKYFRMLSMSVWMSYPLIRAVPDVGGNSPVRIDLQRKKTKQDTNILITKLEDGFGMLIFPLIINDLNNKK